MGVGYLVPHSALFGRSLKIAHKKGLEWRGECLTVSHARCSHVVADAVPVFRFGGCFSSLYTKHISFLFLRVMCGGRRGVCKFLGHTAVFTFLWNNIT